MVSLSTPFICATNISAEIAGVSSMFTAHYRLLPQTSFLWNSLDNRRSVQKRPLHNIWKAHENVLQSYFHVILSFQSSFISFKTLINLQDFFAVSLNQ